MQKLEFGGGDRVRVRKRRECGGGKGEGEGVVTYEGVVMPTGASSERGEKIVIKLESGYNIGVRLEDADAETEVEVEVVSKVVSRAEALKEGERKEKQVRELKDGLPSLSFLSTGGTIASKVDYRTGAVSPQFSTEDILEAVPELGEIANIRGRVVYSLLSENMRAEYWQRLAREVFNEIKNGAEGVVVTHGTDTLGYTAAALSFMLQTPVPVVLVGSQRSSDRPSSDAAMNAICAAKVAACSDLAEVVVVMHGSTSDDFCLVHRGTRVRKMHTSARDAFRSVNETPIGRVLYDPNDVGSTKVELFSGYRNRKRGEQELELRDKFEARCGLVKFYPGADPAVLDFFVEQGYKGVVLEGTGLGHVSADWIPSVARAVKRGVPVVMTSQCLHGRICDRVYDTGRDLLRAGVIEGGDLLPETALVKLMWVLGQTGGTGESELEKVRRLMQEKE